MCLWFKLQMNFALQISLLVNSFWGRRSYLRQWVDSGIERTRRNVRDTGEGNLIIPNNLLDVGNMEDRRLEEDTKISETRRTVGW